MINLIDVVNKENTDSNSIQDVSNSTPDTNNSSDADSSNTSGLGKKSTNKTNENIITNNCDSKESVNINKENSPNMSNSDSESNLNNSASTNEKIDEQTFTKEDMDKLLESAPIGESKPKKKSPRKSTNDSAPETEKELDSVVLTDQLLKAIENLSTLEPTENLLASIDKRFNDFESTLLSKLNRYSSVINSPKIPKLTDQTTELLKKYLYSNNKISVNVSTELLIKVSQYLDETQLLKISDLINTESDVNSAVVNTTLLFFLREYGLL